MSHKIVVNKPLTSTITSEINDLIDEINVISNTLVDTLTKSDIKRLIPVSISR